MVYFSALGKLIRLLSAKLRQCTEFACAHCFVDSRVCVWANWGLLLQREIYTVRVFDGGFFFFSHLHNDCSVAFLAIFARNAESTLSSSPPTLPRLLLLFFDVFVFRLLWMNSSTIRKYQSTHAKKHKCMQFHKFPSVDGFFLFVAPPKHCRYIQLYHNKIISWMSLLLREKKTQSTGKTFRLPPTQDNSKRFSLSLSLIFPSIDVIGRHDFYCFIRRIFFSSRTSD